MCRLKRLSSKTTTQSALIFQNPLRVCRNWHHVRLTTGCRGFSGPVPPPLSMKNFSSALIQLVKVRGEVPAAASCGRQTGFGVSHHRPILSLAIGADSTTRAHFCQNRSSSRNALHPMKSPVCAEPYRACISSTARFTSSVMACRRRLACRAASRRFRANR